MGIVLTSEDLERALDEFRLKIGDLQQRIELLELKLREKREAPVDLYYPKDGSPPRKATPEDFAEMWDNMANRERRWSEEDFRG